MKTTANIIGRNGSFGKFLERNYFEHNKKSSTVVLAIPASAFEEVCKEHKGKYFINVCSVQYETNKICKKYGDRFLGVHLLFGHRSIRGDKRCIFTTNKNDYADIAISHGWTSSYMSARKHDELMAKTHKVALEIAEKYAKHFRKIKVYDTLLPSSVVKLREALYLLDEMPKGTVDSIKSNPF